MNFLRPFYFSYLQYYLLPKHLSPTYTPQDAGMLQDASSGSLEVRFCHQTVWASWLIEKYFLVAVSCRHFRKSVPEHQEKGQEKFAGKHSWLSARCDGDTCSKKTRGVTSISHSYSSKQQNTVKFQFPALLISKKHHRERK